MSIKLRVVGLVSEGLRPGRKGGRDRVLCLGMGQGGTERHREEEHGIMLED
jgi:hypothetical protein